MASAITRLMRVSSTEHYAKRLELRIPAILYEYSMRKIRPILQDAIDNAIRANISNVFLGSGHHQAGFWITVLHSFLYLRVT